MKQLFAFLFLVSSFTLSHGGIMVVEGKYQNKNIYIQNAFTQIGVGYCVFAVYVNDRLTNDEINATAFEIDLAQLQFNYGQEVTIKILHKDGCNPPLVINPDALK